MSRTTVIFVTLMISFVTFLFVPMFFKRQSGNSIENTAKKIAELRCTAKQLKVNSNSADIELSK